MNLQQVFCFHDSKSGTYGPPITAPNKAVFIRDILWPKMREQGSIIASHPQDFGVYHLGEYDAGSGVWMPVKQPTCLGLVSDFDVKNQ